MKCLSLTKPRKWKTKKKPWEISLLCENISQAVGKLKRQILNMVLSAISWGLKLLLNLWHSWVFSGTIRLSWGGHLHSNKILRNRPYTCTKICLSLIGHPFYFLILLHPGAFHITKISIESVPKQRIGSNWCTRKTNRGHQASLCKK